MTIKCRLVYRVNKRGQITFGHGKRAYVREDTPVRNRAMRVTAKGKAYLMALALERDEFEESE